MCSLRLTENSMQSPNYCSNSAMLIPPFHKPHIACLSVCSLICHYLFQEFADQADDGVFEVGAGRDGSLGDGGDPLSAVRPHRLEHLVLTVKR